MGVKKARVRTIREKKKGTFENFNFANEAPSHAYVLNGISEGLGTRAALHLALLCSWEGRESGRSK